MAVPATQTIDSSTARRRLEWRPTRSKKPNDMTADQQRRPDVASRHQVLIVAPLPPPYGGMALQARLLQKLLGRDGNGAVFFPSNFAFPERLRWLSGLPGIRTVLRAIMIWPKLWRQVRQAEVVHVLAASWTYFFLVVYPAVIVGHLCGKRVVLNYRGGEAKRFFRSYGWAARPAFRLADVITTPSQFLAEVIRDQFHVSVTIVPNILDTGMFQPGHRTTVRPKMLIARHLEKMYDIETALKAFRIVQEHHPDASLWIAGTGSQEKYLRGLVATWNLQGVRFLGPVVQQDLPTVYRQCDILLNASCVDNFPGTLIEASAAGLIVVSTNPGGIPYIYQSGKNALLVEPGDWQGLALAVERALACPSRALELANEALAIVRACDWKQVRRSLYGAYDFGLANAPDETSTVVRGGG
jgi:glycosyltransferase involved in cell wall biosynthesis